MGKTLEKRSIVKSTRLFWRWIFLIICIMIAVLIYSISKNNVSYLNEVDAMVDAQVDRLDETFFAINLYMNNILSNNENLICLKKADQTVERIYYANCLRSDIESSTGFLPDGYCFCIDIPDQNVYFYVAETSSSFSKRQKLQEVIKDEFHVEDIKNTLEWKMTEVNGDIYLLQNYYSEGCYITCWIAAADAFAFLDTGFVSGKADYQLLTDNRLYSDAEINPWNGRIKRNVQMKRLSAVISYEYFHQKTIQSTMLLLWVFVFFFFCVITYSVWVSLYCQRKIIMPLQKFCQRVSNESSLEEVLDENTFQELSDAASLIQTLYTQISNLKINVYEETIKQQKAELEFLQLQLRPHFYINCLNIIFQMAQNSQYEKIQHFCVKLSNYMRYLFSSSVDAVPLQMELEHIREYLYIQNVRFHAKVEIEDESLPDVQLEVPSLVLLSLVENSVKHNQINLAALKIRLNVRVEDSMICYTVQDNGKGFQHTKVPLEYADIIAENKNSVGLRNIIRRMEILYGDQFSVKLFNDDGAVVEICIPKSKGMQDEIYLDR
ncbi:MAG: histidine kinase [Lachnospiraceae bacterium]|nr:histidine kinase [Lachnospiraceae bacterium]MBD5456146.1 histidine kinase [Lachnospiraceae bacterium]